MFGLQSLLDLMGDESNAPSSIATAQRQQTTQDLLADIFGTSNDESPAAAPSSAPTKPSVNDILGLFNSTTLSPQPTGGSNFASPAIPVSPSVGSSTGDLFSSLSSQPAAVSTSPTAHEAYNSNGLKITLTPVRDAANPLLVNIMARFTSSMEVQAVNFQAAVPKVRPYSQSMSMILIRAIADSTTADARHVETRRLARLDRNSTTPRHGPHQRRASASPLSKYCTDEKGPTNRVS